MFYILWVACIIGTAYIAAERKRNAAGWAVLSIFTGPLALFIVAVLPALEIKSKPLPEYYGSEIPGLALKLQLEEIRREFQGLNNKLHNLEVKINLLGPDNPLAETSVPEPKPSEARVSESVSVSAGEDAIKQRLEGQARLEKSTPDLAQKSKDLEINLGKFWLNKIGIVIFALGVSFLITYAFKYFGPFLRIILGYAVSCGLFILGVNLEKKDKFCYFGRVLIGGSWALAYFTTFAMHHFKASKIIFSQPLELLLLAIVVMGMIKYSLRYKSEVVTAAAFFIGYFTSTLGNISSFTLAGSLLLAIGTLFLVYRMQWLRFIFLGIACVYLTHLFWVVKNLAFPLVSAAGPVSAKNIYFMLNAGFLSLYWVLFLASAHVIKDRIQEDKLSAANFFNFLFYFLMVFPKFHLFYPEHKLNFVLGLSALYMLFAVLCNLSGRKKLLTSNIIIALALLTLAVPIKFIPCHTTMIWFIELPFLLFTGLVFRRPVYRWMSFILAFILFFKYLFWDTSGFTGLAVLNNRISWLELLSFIGAVSMAVAYSLCWVGKKKFAWVDQGLDLANFFSAFALIYLTRFLWEFSAQRWMTYNLFLEAVLVLICGALLLDKYLRNYAIFVLLLAAARFCLFDYYARVNLGNWILIASSLAMSYAAYAVYKILKNKSLLDSAEERLPTILFFGSTILLIFAFFRYIPDNWISLSLGLAGVIFFSVGFLFKDKIFRQAGFIVFALTLARIIFVDLSGLAIIYKIFSFIILGIIFLGVSYLYTKYKA